MTRPDVAGTIDARDANVAITHLLRLRHDFQFFFEAGITENLDLEVARGGRLRPEHIARKTVQDNRLELFVLGIPRGDHQDRKSTRLNSSHVKISYAVFCLKKKIRQCKLE